MVQSVTAYLRDLRQALMSVRFSFLVRPAALYQSVSGSMLMATLISMLVLNIQILSNTWKYVSIRKCFQSALQYYASLSELKICLPDAMLQHSAHFLLQGFQSPSVHRYCFHVAFTWKTLYHITRQTAHSSS